MSNVISFKIYSEDNQFYRPQTKLRKGNVFTSVFQEFCPWGCVHWGRHPPCRHPPADTPPSPADGYCNAFLSNLFLFKLLQHCQLWVLQDSSNVVSFPPSRLISGFATEY